MLRHMFCPKCGQQQDQSEECEYCGLIFERYRDDIHPEPEKSSRRSIFRTVRLLLLIPSLAALLLLLIPQTTPPSFPDPEAPDRMRQKIARVAQEVERGKAQQLRLDEWEVNSWLDQNLARAMAETQAELEGEFEETGSIQDLVVAFEEDRVNIHLQFEVLSKDLSLSLVGRIDSSEGYLRLDVDSGRMGALPLPRSVLQRAMSNVFNDPRNYEKFQLPDGVEDIRIEKGQLVVDYESRAQLGKAL